MRRAFVTLLAAVLLSLVVALPSAGAADTSPQQNEPAAGSPSIIPSPNQRGENNFGGLIVGVVLLGGWSLLGYGLYRQARNRRAAGAAALAAAPAESA